MLINKNNILYSHISSAGMIDRLSYGVSSAGNSREWYIETYEMNAAQFIAKYEQLNLVISLPRCAMCEASLRRHLSLPGHGAWCRWPACPSAARSPHRRCRHPRAARTQTAATGA